MIMADGLPFEASMCYCQYSLDGEVVITDLDAMGDVSSRGPVQFDHEHEHELGRLTQEAVDELSKSFEIEVYAR